MPNGKPRDHPITDIRVHGLPVFPGDGDELVKEIVDLAGFPAIYESLNVDWLDLERRAKDPDQREKVVDQLRALRDRLKRDAGARGWDVD